MKSRKSLVGLAIFLQKKRLASLANQNQSSKKTAVFGSEARYSDFLATPLLESRYSQFMI
jgi:hypothetical protein